MTNIEKLDMCKNAVYVNHCTLYMCLMYTVHIQFKLIFCGIFFLYASLGKPYLNIKCVSFSKLQEL